MGGRCVCVGVPTAETSVLFMGVIVFDPHLAFSVLPKAKCGLSFYLLKT